MPKNKNIQYDYQLDLTPFISLLSVCICFLLVTVAWYQVGALSMKQVLGGDMSANPSAEDKNSLWIWMESQNNFHVKIKKGSKELQRKKISSTTQEDKKTFDYKMLKDYVSSLKKQNPKLTEAFILPSQQTSYEELIKVMDRVRQAGLFNIGVSPL